MTQGAGKYDDECTRIREALNAEGVVVIVVNGARGSGYSAQGTLRAQALIVESLAILALQMATDIEQITRGPTQ